MEHRTRPEAMADWLDQDLKIKRITVVVILGLIFIVTVVSMALLSPPRCAVSNHTTYCIEVGPEGADIVIKE